MLPQYILIKDKIIRAIDDHHLTQEGFAQEIGLSRSHWSLVLNGHRPATARIRRALREHRITKDIPEGDLWAIESSRDAVAC